MQCRRGVTFGSKEYSGARVSNKPTSSTSYLTIIQQQPLKIPIPTFDGSYAAWSKLKAIFNDLMANSGDTDAIKLYHLDKALIGNAAGALDAKILSEGKYKQARYILMDRYNKRAIIDSLPRIVILEDNVITIV